MFSSINFPTSNNDLCKFHDTTRSLKCSEEHTTFSLFISWYQEEQNLSDA